MSGYRPYGQQNQWPPQPGYPPQPPKKKRRWWLIIGLPALVVLLIAGGTTYALVAENKKNSAGADNSDQAGQQLSAAAKQGPLTDAQLRKINATDLYYSVFKTMLRRTLLHTKSEGLTPGDKTGEANRVDMTTDLSTKKYGYESETYSGKGGATESLGSFRCVNGQLYYSDEINGQRIHDWHTDPDSDNKKCTSLADVEAYVSDGMATGGFTKAQADAMVGELRRYDDFLQAKQLTLADRNGKQYLRFAVQVTPVKLEDGNYYGMQRFMFAFKETGLDPTTYPYIFDGAVAGGMRFVMYVDPATLLPSYGQFVTTPPVDKNNKPELTDFETRYSQTRLEYDFTRQQVPALDTTSYRRITLSWQAEAFPPQQGDWKP